MAYHICGETPVVGVQSPPPLWWSWITAQDPYFVLLCGEWLKNLVGSLGVLTKKMLGFMYAMRHVN